jgi:DNA-binding transcriptional MerR regulator
MFLIGEFANLARVSTRVLRHYDRIGLLAPTHVDPDTGYRYYGASQLADANRIVAMRDLGFGLSEIGEMTQNEMTALELRSLLTSRQEQVAAELEAAEQRLRRIGARISQLEEGTSSIDLVQRSIPAQAVWTMPYETATIEEALDALSSMVRDMSEHVDDLVAPYGLAQWTGYDEERFTMEIAVPVDPGLEVAADNAGMQLAQLPAVEVISAVRASHRRDIHITNGAIGRWIENEPVTMAGPIREVLLADPIVGDPEQVVEVQVPILVS